MNTWPSEVFRIAALEVLRHKEAQEDAGRKEHKVDVAQGGSVGLTEGSSGELYQKLLKCTMPALKPLSAASLTVFSKNCSVLTKKQV